MPRRRDPSSARLYSVRVAVREADLLEFRNEAHQRGISVSALLFRRLIAARPVAATDSKVAAHLGKIGANLNQLAHRANIGQVVGVTSGELRDLYEVIRSLRLTFLGGGS